MGHGNPVRETVHFVNSSYFVTFIIYELIKKVDIYV
jgi:hypothetical protein